MILFLFAILTPLVLHALLFKRERRFGIALLIVLVCVACAAVPVARVRSVALALAFPAALTAAHFAKAGIDINLRRGLMLNICITSVIFFLYIFNFFYFKKFIILFFFI